MDEEIWKVLGATVGITLFVIVVIALVIILPARAQTEECANYGYTGATGENYAVVGGRDFCVEMRSENGVTTIRGVDVVDLKAGYGQ